jgi:uncharacterized surface protein with fasciclin (FAS1) repeats
MCNPSNSKTTVKYRLVILSMILVCIFLTFCKQEPSLWTLKSEEQVASEFIKNHAEYSEFAKLVEITGLDPLLGIRGPYTIMLPTNDAMSAYYKEKGKSALTDFDMTFLASLVRNHIIDNEIPTGDFGLGALRDTNALGDFVVTEFEGSDIILNKNSKIINRDIRLANGYAHVIDKVLDIITKDVYTMLAENPSYKILTEGLKLTGLKDTLQLISFPYGKRTARTRFTILAVPDSVYNANNIFNVDDLIKWTGANPDSLTYLENPFYRYIEYHCLDGTHYLSDLNTGLYPILSHDNNVLMTIDNDYKINLHPKNQSYTSFNIPASNVPAKNGAIHAINDLLPVTQPSPVKMVFETTDYFDVKQGEYYLKGYMNWVDGKNTFKNIKWEGDFLQYYCRESPYEINQDCFKIAGFFWIEITTPKIMKGTYKVNVGIRAGYLALDHFVDGLKAGSSKVGDSAIPDLGVHTWTTTTEHKIRLVSMSWGQLFWDTIIFTPVN